MAGDRAWLIDAPIYVFRGWFSLPDRWRTRDGTPLQGVYGYMRFLLDFLDRAGHRFYGAVAFDESLGSNFRNDIYPDYKSSRELPDEDLAFQFLACRRITELLGLPCYGGARYEADDYLATIARQFQEKGIPVTVVTRDKDLGQIMQGEADAWWDFAGDITLDSAGFSERFGVSPAQFADYLALVGDPVDDIPGVPGIGAKTAAALLQAFDSLEQLGANLDDVAGLSMRGAGRVQEKLREHWEQVLLARQLTGLETAIPEVATLPEFQLESRALGELAEYLDELNLTGPLTRRCQALAKTLEGAG